MFCTNLPKLIIVTSADMRSNPDIVKESQKIINAHSEDPLGTRHEFTTSNGEEFICVISMHDSKDMKRIVNGKPLGLHHACTVYWKKKKAPEKAKK